MSNTILTIELADLASVIGGKNQPWKMKVDPIPAAGGKGPSSPADPMMCSPSGKGRLDCIDNGGMHWDVPSSGATPVE